ncbi:MAG: hypothetical protein CME32_24745 [Gimesia sp.]|nr:hypothetical protein [Gimesia sp.]
MEIDESIDGRGGLFNRFGEMIPHLFSHNRCKGRCKQSIQRQVTESFLESGVAGFKILIIGDKPPLLHAKPDSHEPRKIAARATIKDIFIQLAHQTLFSRPGQMTVSLSRIRNFRRQ